VAAVDVHQLIADRAGHLVERDAGAGAARERPRMSYAGRG
jgi:hypothetical protein